MTSFATRASTTLSALGLILALAPRAQASGFQLREQSPRFQGNSFAGVSAGGDLGAIFFNPATLTGLSGHQFLLGASYVMPSAVFSNGSASRAATFPAPVHPISGAPAHRNAGQDAPLPALAALWDLSPDLKLGFSFNVPFGMGTEYDRNWMGRYHAIKSDFRVMDFAPAAAYRFDERWSVGLALVARRAEATLSNAVDFGAIGAAMAVPGSVPGAADGFAEVKGHDWGYGFRVGVLFEPAKTLRLGFGYQSKVDHTLTGDVRYENVPAALGGVFKNAPVTAGVSLPEMASLGLDWELTPDLSLQAEAAWTKWSRFQELRMDFASSQPDSVTEEKWKDSTFVALGANYRLGSAWTLRAGLARDTTPEAEAYRTPRIPDADRTWVSAGIGYRVSSRLSLDVGYSHIFVKDSRVDLKAGGPTNPDFFRGNLAGDYRNHVDIFAAQMRLSF